MSDCEEQPPTPESDTPIEADGEMKVKEVNNPEIEEEKTDDEKKPKDYWSLPIYVTCKLCSGLYKFPVKTNCGSECEATACKACALKQATKLKKCWNTDCEKPIDTDSLVSDKDQQKAVDKWFTRMKKWDDNLKTGKVLKCTLCENICQDGVSTPCCALVACRGCAVKKIADIKECWGSYCKAPDMTEEKLVEDELLQKAIEHFEENGVMDIEHAKEISGKRADLLKVIVEKNKKVKKAKKGDNNASRRQPPNEKKSFVPGWQKDAPRRGQLSTKGGGGYVPNSWQPRGGHGPRMGGPPFRGNGMRGGPPFHGNGMRGGPPFHGNGMRGGPPFHGNNMRGGPQFHGNYGHDMGGNNMYCQNLEWEHQQMKMMLMNGGGGGGMGMNRGGGMGMSRGGMGMNGGQMDRVRDELPSRYTDGGMGMMGQGGIGLMDRSGMGMRGGGRGMGMRGGEMGMRGRGGRVENTDSDISENRGVELWDL